MAYRPCSYVYSPLYYGDFGEHVFPTVKFERVYRSLLADGDIPENCFCSPEPASLEDLRRVHTEQYLDDLLSLRPTVRTISSELPLTDETVRVFIMAAGGTILACANALEDGLAMSLTGGFHHAFPDHAEGFCYINDVAVALRKLKAEGCIRRATVVDCDVHQGNGTAFIFRNEPSIFTFSMHQELNYPVKQSSSLDVGLADGTDDTEYLSLLKANFPRLLDSAQPELIVYLAGADVLEQDQLGGLALTLEGLKQRDEYVVNECMRHDIPLAAVLAGGYARNIDDTVQAHHATCRVLWQAGCQHRKNRNA